MERSVGVVPRLLVSREYREELERLVGLAGRSVMLVSYVLSPVVAKRKGAAWSVLATLGEAAARGVNVRVIFERAPRERAGVRAARDACRLLREMGVQARLGPEGLVLHSKYVVLDGVYSIVGSHNLTNRSLTRNYEVSVLLGDGRVARDLEGRFERLWRRSGEPKVRNGEGER